MAKPLRLGIGISAADDPFWLQVHGAIYQRGSKHPVKLIPIHRGFYPEETPEEYGAILDELAAQELDVLLGCNFPDFLTNLVLDKGLPVVHLYETRVVHPLAVSPVGLRQIAEELSHYLASLVNGSGNILVIGGMLRENHPDDGRSRIAGIRTAFAEYPDIHFHHLQTDWLNNAELTIRSQLANWTQPVNAIFGLSDSLALLGREIALEMGFCADTIPVVGINGDPLALVAIMEGQMIATVETPAVNLANRAFDIAIRIATDQPYPAHYEFSPRLVTANNVTTVTTQKMSGVSEISSYIINYERGAQQEHESALKCSAEMSRLLAAASDYESLPAQLAGVIRSRCGFDHAQLYYWSEREQRLTFATNGDSPARLGTLSGARAGVLGEAGVHGKPILIPDCQRSRRCLPDAAAPDTRTRVILPVRHGARVVGVLDLHAFRLLYCSDRYLSGLQSLADQIGVSIENTRLSREALRAKVAAEKAQRLKALLLEGIREQLRASSSGLAVNSDRTELSERTNNTSKRMRADNIRLLRLLDDLLEARSDEIDPQAFEYDPSEPGATLFDAPASSASLDVGDFVPAPFPTSTVVRDTIAYIQAHFGERISRSELASAVGVSESYLTQIFRRLTGISLWDYLVRYRIHQAKVLLRQTNDSIADISALVGFDDPAYFSRVFRRAVGQSPRDYRASPSS